LVGLDEKLGRGKLPAPKRVHVTISLDLIHITGELSIDVFKGKDDEPNKSCTLRVKSPAKSTTQSLP
jgi:hypothetical protein